MEVLRGWPESLRKYDEELIRDAVALTYKADKGDNITEQTHTR